MAQRGKRKKEWKYWAIFVPIVIVQSGSRLIHAVLGRFQQRELIPMAWCYNVYIKIKLVHCKIYRKKAF